MKVLFTILCLFLQVTASRGQTGIVVERDAATGSDRILLATSNLNDGDRADNEFRIRTGTGDNMVTSWILNYANSYTGAANYAGYLTISNDTKGIILRNEVANSDMRFLLGGFEIQNHQKMILTSTGNLGVGAFSPAAKIQVKNGDVYIEDIGSGVIMKSPDGSCWRMTVTDAGASQFDKLTDCPGVVNSASED